jgi:threonine dehydratase
MTGADLFFKCENSKHPGAFKVRGASNAVFGLDDEQAETGRGNPFIGQPRVLPQLYGQPSR